MEAPNPRRSVWREAYRLAYARPAAPPKPKRWTPPGPLFDLSILGFALALGIAHLAA